MRPYHRKLSVEPIRVLVRHADAGQRTAWNGHDGLRELTRLGHAQADDVAARIGGMPILRVLASPALRCQQTVMPLANELCVRVERCSLLARDADPDDLLRFLQLPETENAVLCTHRETLLRLFELLVDDDPLRVVAGTEPMLMASAWLLQGGAGGPYRLRYVRPPSTAFSSAASSSTADDADHGSGPKTEHRGAPAPG
jgi:phosphohistidine phosphatase SixA